MASSSGLYGPIPHRYPSEGRDEPAQRGALARPEELVEHQQGARRAQHPGRFLQAGQGLGDHGEDEVQHHRVEAGIREGQVHGIALDRKVMPPGRPGKAQVQHGRGEVEPDVAVLGRRQGQIQSGAHAGHQHVEGRQGRQAGEAAGPRRASRLRYDGVVDGCDEAVAAPEAQTTNQPGKLSWSSFDDPRSLIPGPSPGGRRGKSPSPIGRGVGGRESPVVIGNAVDSAASTAVSRLNRSAAGAVAGHPCPGQAPRGIVYDPWLRPLRPAAVPAGPAIPCPSASPPPTSPTPATPPLSWNCWTITPGTPWAAVSASPPTPGNTW